MIKNDQNQDFLVKVFLQHGHLPADKMKTFSVDAGFVGQLELVGLPVQPPFRDAPASSDHSVGAERKHS